MQKDPIVSLAMQFRSADHASGLAAKRGELARAEQLRATMYCIYARALSVPAQNPCGAACQLHISAALVEGQGVLDDATAATLGKDINAIAYRCARRKQTLNDVVRLRAIKRDLGNLAQDHAAASCARVIGLALAGIARPVLAAG